MTKKNIHHNLNATFKMHSSSLSCEDLSSFLGETQQEQLRENPFDYEESSTKTTLTTQKLGEGGYGSVFIGQQNMPHREIAIKILNHDSEEDRKNLLQEANIIGRLEHPNIIPIHEVIIDENEKVQILMKKVEGQTLKAFVDKLKDPTVRIKQGTDILIQVCHALEFAHADFILHRDIKCENIMIGPFNEVYLMDWGLAFEKIFSLRISRICSQNILRDCKQSLSSKSKSALSIYQRISPNIRTS